MVPNLVIVCLFVVGEIFWVLSQSSVVILFGEVVDHEPSQKSGSDEKYLIKEPTNEITRTLR